MDRRRDEDPERNGEPGDFPDRGPLSAAPFRMRYDGINRRARTRYYRDTDHRTWRVFPRQKHDLDGQEKTVLVFETPNFLRCVSNYPDDWPTFSPASLERLSWQT